MSTIHVYSFKQIVQVDDNDSLEWVGKNCRRVVVVKPETMPPALFQQLTAMGIKESDSIMVETRGIWDDWEEAIAHEQTK